jgi:hypothetical protein
VILLTAEYAESAEKSVVHRLELNRRYKNFNYREHRSVVSFIDLCVLCVLCGRWFYRLYTNITPEG